MLTTYKEAGKALRSALEEQRFGFVARVSVQPGQAALATLLAEARRAYAKLSLPGNDNRNFDAALKIRDQHQLGNFFSDKRAMLAEIVINELLYLGAGRGNYSMQPFVDTLPAPGADVIIKSREYDIKSASQVSALWSTRPVVKNQFVDDRAMTINGVSHADYAANANFSGYICVYFYIDDEMPEAADVFVIPSDNLGELQQPTIQGSTGYRDMRYYTIQLPFPDALHRTNFEARKERAKAAAQGRLAAAEV